LPKPLLRPNLRTVREKSQDQLDLQACHRVRSRLVSRRTATINQIRAFLILPAALRERAEQFLAVNAACFDEIMKDLSADVGWGFFPENAAAFITTLIGNLESSSPETTCRWRSEPETEEVGFCEPLASK
jgi:hypothetical protein